MDEIEKFDRWAKSLDLDWNGKRKEQEWILWLRGREDAGFNWARNRVLREVKAREKKRPMTEEENQRVADLDITAEIVLLISSDCESEPLYDLLYFVSADFNLLARAARVDFSNPWLDKLRNEYEQGRFPRGSF